MSRSADIYAGVDPTEVPLYSVPDASRMLRLKSATIHTWAYGRPYDTAGGRKKWPALIHAPARGRLCFKNLVELHVLSALRLDARTVRRVSVGAIRSASTELAARIGTKHPLADVDLHTDFVDIYADVLGRLLNVSAPQQPIKDVIAPLLHRIERDAAGIARRLHVAVDAQNAGLIVIDPRRRFGRPVLVSSNVETAVVYDRFARAEPLSTIVEDLELERAEAEAAIQFEVVRRKAA